MPDLGDYGCVHTPGFVGKLIRIFLRSRVNHAFIYIGDNKVVEARPSGAGVADLSEYSDITWGREELSKAQRKVIVGVAKDLIGTPYGFLDIFFLWAKELGVHLKFVESWVKRGDRMICSQLVAYCYKEANHILCDEPDYDVTPKDLYERALSHGTN